MEKTRKFELIKRSLGLKHKLKVLESMKLPENHEEIAKVSLAIWEIQDELAAIDSLLEEARIDNKLKYRAKYEAPKQDYFERIAKEISLVTVQESNSG